MKPPRIFIRFFRWFCHPDLQDPIEGDLMELYHERLIRLGKRKADLRFLVDVLLLLRRDIIRPAEGNYRLNSFGIFKNNLKTGYRNLIKRKGFAAINMLGLSSGLLCFLVILLFVRHESSFDSTFEDKDRIFKMVRQLKDDEGSALKPSTPYSFVRTMQEDFPEVEAGTAFSGPYSGQRVQVLNEAGQKVNFLESGILLADSNFFKVFSFKMLAGDRQTALSKPHSVVLTESSAKRFFGDRNPLGEFFSASGKSSIVTGVCEDPPANSHFDFSYLVSSTSVGWFSQENFNLRRAHCFYKLRKGSSVEVLETKLPDMARNYVGKEIERIRGISWNDYLKTGESHVYQLKPLTSIYLDSRINKVMKSGGNRTLLRVLTGIAVLIFVLACINFVNLSTARSAERAKEVGVRKVLGSGRSQLIMQFMTESLILTGISVVVATISAILLLPYFNAFFDLSLTFELNWQFFLYSLSVTILVTILAGFYPALIMSSFRAVFNLKGLQSKGAGNTIFKNSLIIFQFWIAFALISGTLIVRRQVDFLTEKALGYDKEQLVVIEGTFSKNPSFSQPFLQSLNNIPGVLKAAPTLWVQGFNGTWSDEYKHSGASEIQTMNRTLVGDGLAELMNFRLLEGTFFSEETNDSLSVILNESAVRALRISDPIGQKIFQVIHDGGEVQEIPFSIKGVISDFHYQSLHEKISPLILQSTEKSAGRMSYIVAKIAPENMAATLQDIERNWNETIKDRPFTFRFLDDVVESKYKGENKIRNMLSLFSGIAIVIAVTGLFGLSAYSVSLRSKEISIRKIIGADFWQIVRLLNSDFLKLITIAFLMAIPITWYFAGEWLIGFAYRTSIGPSVFLLAGLLILLPVWMILGFQSLRAAYRNPVDFLKNE